METRPSNMYWYRLKPYVVIALAALAAYLPVSSMLFSLRNDVLAIEYPVQHFISEAIRNGENPVWFNTWCMGFPLQSVLTWSIFSTPRTLIGTLLPSDVLVLHLEFLFYVMLAGWSMFTLLKDHFSTGRNMAILLSCCYMLSGFTVGSSQWLLYITGMSFIPLVMYCTLSLTRNPSAEKAFFFALSYLLLLTNVHIYLTVFTSYGIALYFIIRLVKTWTDRKAGQAARKKFTQYTALAFLLTVVFAAAPIYYTAELVALIERSNPLKEGSAFFRSNYLHPAELKSLLLPLSTVKSLHANTEGSVQSIYIGLLPLLLLVPSGLHNRARRNRQAWWILLTAVFFLLLSLGHLTPLRGWMNVLPGLAHFRHPAVLRVFFIMAIILYLGITFGENKLEDLVSRGAPARKHFLYGLYGLGLALLALILANAGAWTTLWKGSVYESTRSVENSQLVLLNSLMQFVIVTVLLVCLQKKPSVLPMVFMTELVMNFLACTPFYAVSSYPVSEVNALFNYTRGFPVQQRSPSAVPAEITDPGGTTWRNTNTFRKEVSTEVSMPGPVILQQTSRFLSSGRKSELENKKLVFIKGGDAPGDQVTVTVQKPGRVRAILSLSAQREVVLQQSYFPGWTASYNGSPLPLVKNEFPFVSVSVPEGRGELEFRFRKKGVLFTALFLHLAVICGLVLMIRKKLRFRSSSPSWLN